MIEACSSLCQCLVCFGGLSKLCGYSPSTHHQKIQTALNCEIIRVIKGSNIKRTTGILSHLGQFFTRQISRKEVISISIREQET